MIPFVALLYLLLVALPTDASPLHRYAANPTLSFIARVNAKLGPNIAETDRARAQTMKQAGHKTKRAGSSSFSINNAVVTYTAQVGVGSPPTNYTLLIDTGSSNTWIGASTPYFRTSTSRDTGFTVSVSYGSGCFSGEEWMDMLTLSPDLIINTQSIGVTTPDQTWGFPVDGVLGVGPTGLTIDTVTGLYNVSTVTDNLFFQGVIGTEMLGIYFVPPSSYDSSGELTFGGYDSSKINGTMNYVPLTTTYPANSYWGINQSITYGDCPILYESAGIVDSGTTLILIASDAFRRYKDATKATKDKNTGLLKISNDHYANLQTLNFIIDGNTYPLIPNAQIWPRSLNYAINGDSDSIYLIISDIGSECGSGLDFINGYAFLQRYYTVYDTSNHQMGFAQTWHTTDAYLN